MVAYVKEIGAGEFKTHCLQLMEQVRERRISIIITKRGLPIAKLVPIDTEPQKLFGCMKNTVTITDNIIEPLDLKWDVENE